MPVYWRGYKLNLAGKAKMMLGRKGGKDQTTVWDVFGFFQGSFVSALKKWSIGTSEQVERIQAMKRKRRDFDQLPFAQIRAYCFEECSLLAELMTELDDAHEAAGLKLKSWFGAGSTASVLLGKLGIEKSLGDPPRDMVLPIHQAFFGGRFEHSLIGPMKGPIYGYDISSAYPFALTHLPCLCHGRWSLTRDKERAQRAAIVLIHYGFTETMGSVPNRPWGPLPFRRKNGNIVFPVRSAGGWSWGVEYWAAERFDPSLEFCEAWVYETDCKCRPFAELAEYYETRLQWGKEARGIVLKLGMNSVYGKLAQSVGSHRYRSLIWAGMVTAHCRGQLLGLMAMHKNPKHILGVATDGLYTTERLKLPAITGKPLGGWERTEYPELFFIQPGVYFQPLESSTDRDTLEKKTRSRGVPRIDVAEQQRRILDSWDRGERTIAIEGLVRFWGVKSSIHRRLKKDGSFDYERSDSYGEWLEHPHVLQYAAEPKRHKLLSNNRLTPWSLGPEEGESTPYDRALAGDQTEAMKEIEQILAEQPEGNFEPIEDD